MADTYDGPFGAYVDGTEVVSAAADVEIQANLVLLLAMIPDPTAGVEAPHPDFDQIPPHTATKLRAEITACAAAIAAAPDA